MPSASFYSRLIEGLLNGGEFDTAVGLFSEMVGSRGLAPDRLLCRSMIRWPCLNGKVDCASVLFDMMARHGLVRDDEFCYEMLILALCRENRFEDAMGWFHRMLDAGIVPGYDSFVMLVRRHPEDQKLDIVCKILEVMSKKCSFSLPSDDSEVELLFEKIAGNKAVSASSALNIWIHYFCLAGKIGSAIIFMEKLVGCGLETSMFTFNAIFKCICKIGGMENHLELVLDHLQKWGLVPNVSTYLILIDSCCKQGDISSALRIHEHMRGRDHFKPTVAIYDSIIGCLCRHRRPSEAMEIFGMMLEDGVKPDEVFYTTLLSGYSRMERALDACTLFGMMIKDGLHPNLHTYSAIINVLIRRNRFRKAYMFLNDMQSKGYVPDTVLYTMLVKQFARKRENGFAFNLYDLMIRDQIEPNLVTVTSMISGTCGSFKAPHLPAEELLEANKFVDLLPQKSARGVLTQRNSSKTVEKRIDEAFCDLRHINPNRVMLDIHYYNGRISLSCLTRKMDDALEHFVSMIDGILPNHMTYTILIGGYIRSAEIGFAVDFFNLMNRQGFIPDKVTYITIIKGLCTARRGDYALYFIHMMQKQGYLPDKNLYEKLIECFCLAHSGDLSLKLLDEMLTHNCVPQRRIYKLLLSLLEENKIWEILHKHGRILSDEETDTQMAEMCYSDKELYLGPENEAKMVACGT